PAGGDSGAAAAGYALAALPGQHAAFDTGELSARFDVVGAPQVRVRVTSTAKDATLFASLWRMTPAGPVSPRGQVVPIRVATTPDTPLDVDLPLPGGTYSMAKGGRWRVLISATDAGYAVPTDARLYTVELADGALVLPTTKALTDAGDAGSGTTGALAEVSSMDREVLGAAAGLAALLLAIAAAALLTWWRRRRVYRRDTRTEDADVPLVVDNLVKTYKDGHRAVDDVSWRAEAGQVVGLLGPNGAGKTTTMRMLVGLIRPDSGAVHVLGEPVRAGAPVLSRVGALIEGPGFLPHLTGQQNLRAYWEATGRDPGDAHIESALEVAALGDAVDRPVRTYSQGMRQRLGIAQAMLGRPEVLLLDEPTNGLDPPQIAAMRPILQDYARTGRTVVVSSHLLAEVEQTCTHVVVMNRGRVVATGSVAELVTGDGTTVVTLGPACDPETVAAALAATPVGQSLREIRLDAPARALTLVGDTPRGEIVAAAVATGADIESVTARRRLEEVFLGVIGGDDIDAHATGSVDERSRRDALRQVRSR
ncbi:MAG: ATP-binding cassette domain-containing protein, partial [Micrococcales bacterium]|nr:ATP-binding cassette domain-containing protein [Micrococcales bacterium]